jgi:hypothetical protein
MIATRPIATTLSSIPDTKFSIQPNTSPKRSFVVNATTARQGREAMDAQHGDLQPRELDNTYVLGSDHHEVVRLDRQAAWLGPATRLLLQAAGIVPGLRVLDLGTGLGHVARLAGELVGLFVAIDFDVGAARAEPRVGLVNDVRDWVMRAFSAAGASPTIGARLGPILAQAGLDDVKTFGIQDYLAPHDSSGPALLAGVVRSLADVITRHGIATVEQLGLATLDRRIAGELRREQAVLLLPTLVGARGRRPRRHQAL